MNHPFEPSLSARHTGHAHTIDHEDWWASLKHGGMLLAPSKIQEHFATSPKPLSGILVEELRRTVDLMRDDDARDLTPLLDTVLEKVLGLQGGWLRGPNVSTRWSVRAITRETLRPRRVWLGPNGAVLPVFVSDGQEGKLETSTRIGVGRGRRAVARVLEWLRRGRGPDVTSTVEPTYGQPSIALLTNGRQWRLIHAGADYDAWCEWDIELWFQDGGPGPQVAALRQLLSAPALTPARAGELSPLMTAIQASRRGQAELSEALGERVRQAVELLIQASSPTLHRLEQSNPVPHRDLYIAATRILMRCVVLLFAEARPELLPRDSAIYQESYSIQGLREQLDRFSGGRAAERLRFSWSAWPRLLSLFRLLHDGSGHELLPIPRYGGGLFRPGDPTSPDPISRAIAAFEAPSNEISDAVVHRMLELLTRSRVRVRQGRSSRWVEAPVDFSDLSSEYIGILYEGLLDYELRRAELGNPILFLNLGDEPALPFLQLNGMNDKELAKLFEKLKQTSKEDAGEESEDSTPEDAAPPEAPADAEPETTEPLGELSPDEPAEEADLLRAVKAVVQDWAERAVKAAGLVKPPRKYDPRAMDAFHDGVARAAKQLVRRIVMPGEWFLIRWGGTRKGAGTFYTRPQLALPTMRRTLEPLCYASPDATHDDELAGQRVPHSPATLIGLKICDPAMGSGSFLVGALRFVSEALYESLHVYGWLERAPDRLMVTVPDAQAPRWFVECVKDLPATAEDAEERMKSRLKRVVVERCLYGVDLDPLAVELARLALWVETMARELPFEFLDHKLKCGNALVGTWLDRFEHYPLLAWERKGGDEGHKNGVHFKDGTWTNTLKEFRERLRQGMVKWLQGEYLLAPEAVFYRPSDVHGDALKELDALHDLPLDHSEERETRYAARFVDHGGEPNTFIRLKRAFDTWCALWFWPADDEHLRSAPLPHALGKPSPDAQVIVRRLATELRFFHWELEFPDVFSRPGSGFDGIIGNPPWEIQKPNSMEFFSNLDPLYRTYGKQEALSRQEALFELPGVEARWLHYNARFKALSNWNRFAATPFGDSSDDGAAFSFSRKAKEHEALLKKWRARLSSASPGYADPAHPYRHQGSADINTYKMFLEVGHALLKEGGRMSLITPSGLYTDKGTAELRALFTRQCHWTHLYVFQNERFVFAHVHHSFKMAIPTVVKGGSTQALRARFRVGPGDSPESHEVEEDILADERYLQLTLEALSKLSPKTGAILEIRSERDLEILKTLYANGVLLGDTGPEGWGITYAREFDMTNDSKLFPPRPKWEEQGYRPDEYGHWLLGPWRPYEGPRSILEREPGLILSPQGTLALPVEEVKGVALPLYQGIMIRAFDNSAKGWMSGTGLRAVWEEIPLTSKSPFPQYLISSKTQATSDKVSRGWKVGYRSIARATDSRTWIGTMLAEAPVGNSILNLVSHSEEPHHALVLSAICNSFTFDWQLRNRLGGTNLSWFVLEENVRPEADYAIFQAIEEFSLRMTCISIAHSREWTRVYLNQPWQWKRLWASTVAERLRIQSILDAIVAELYGLAYDDLAWILRDCDHPVESLRSSEISRTLDPKGFWRVDRELDPELRHPVLTLVAFRELKQRGLEEFLAQNEGEGWMLPETLCLAELGLGHDDRAKEAQPVASRLGPRFLPWQLEQGVEESWEECRRHANLINEIRTQGGQVGQTDASEVEAATIPREHASARAGKPQVTPAAPDAPGKRGRKPAEQREAAAQLGLFGKSKL